MSNRHPTGEEGAERAYLGTGWSFPPTFSRVNSSVVMVSGDRDVYESLWIILSTSLGERVMLAEFGSQLWQMVFQAMTTTLANRLREIVRRAILTWEPRVDVDRVDVEREPTVDGLLMVTVEYTVRSTNSRSNLVYPFYLQEGSVPQAPQAGT
ncbi:MAG: GPW/gp25 family protein [Acidobacteriota bacterium]